MTVSTNTPTRSHAGMCGTRPLPAGIGSPHIELPTYRESSATACPRQDARGMSVLAAMAVLGLVLALSFAATCVIASCIADKQ
jgi:hypothetical protein